MDDKFSIFCSKLDKDGYLLKWILEFVKDKNNNYFIHYLPEVPVSQINHSDEHPFIKIGRKMIMCNNYQINQSLLLFYNNSTILNSLKFHNHYIQKNDFVKYLMDNFKGSFIIYKTNNQNDKYLKLDDNFYLFGISWILPWAGSVLKENFNCFMIDTTFRAISPYVLTIFNVIYANNSIPICIFISPSEKWTSYDRAWKHLNQYINNLGIKKIYYYILL